MARPARRVVAHHRPADSDHLPRVALCGPSADWHAGDHPEGAARAHRRVLPPALPPRPDGRGGGGRSGARCRRDDGAGAIRWHPGPHGAGGGPQSCGPRSRRASRERRDRPGGPELDRDARHQGHPCRAAHGRGLPRQPCAADAGRHDQSAPARAVAAPECAVPRGAGRHRHHRPIAAAVRPQCRRAGAGAGGRPRGPRHRGPARAAPRLQRGRARSGPARAAGRLRARLQRARHLRKPELRARVCVELSRR